MSASECGIINRPRERVIALCDCNNFFVSCERRRDPSLCGRPVVVLSGGDGIIVARSNEAKAIGIPMAAPLFKCEGLLKHYDSIILSGDMPYYAQVSDEVKNELAKFTPALENYSIDESFMDFDIMCEPDRAAYADRVRRAVLKNCGVPVSVGVASSKTLAKLASKQAKKQSGVFVLDGRIRNDEAFMRSVPAKDVWGIGEQTRKKLESYFGVRDAWSVAAMDDLTLKTRFSVNLLQTAWELRGRSVFPIAENRDAPKTIRVSRTFGEPIYGYDDLRSAVMYFAASAARQLRAAKQRAGRLTVYARSSRFHEDFYSRAGEKKFALPVSLDRDILTEASKLLEGIYAEGVRYAKAAVMLSDFTDERGGRQTSLFEAFEPKRELAADTADMINLRAGRVIIAPADHFLSDSRSKWVSKKEHGLETELPRLPLAPARRVGF